MAWTWLVATCAFAQSSGYSVDVELLSPALGAQASPGVDRPRTDRPGTVRLGTLVQLQDDPVTVYDAVQDIELGAVVARRATAALGISGDVSRRLTLDLSLPVAQSWGTEVPELAADGPAVGDLALGARWVAVHGPVLAVGVQTDLRLPTGNANAWLGERGVRLSPAVLASADLGPVTIATDTGLQLRPPLATAEDLNLGQELRTSGALRLGLPSAMRTALVATLLGRTGLRPGPGQAGLEALGGVQLRPTRDTTVDLAAGRGLTEGYGTTDLRLVAGLTHRLRAAPRPPIARRIPPPPPPPQDADLPEPDIPPDFGGRQARVTKTHIELAQQPRFVVDTSVLLESSRPLIDEVAGLFTTNPDLSHVLIEGHASQEGSHAHNYDLSLRRAAAIARALIEAGVDQDRISIRAKGETEPVADGDSAAALERNRRVRFEILRRHDPGAIPTARASQPLPWTDQRGPVSCDASAGAACPEEAAGPGDGP